MHQQVSQRRRLEKQLLSNAMVTSLRRYGVIKTVSGNNGNDIRAGPQGGVRRKDHEIFGLMRRSVLGKRFLHVFDQVFGEYFTGQFLLYAPVCLFQGLLVLG